MELGVDIHEGETVVMCGICGIYGFDDHELIKHMCKKLRHRGPDSDGSFKDERIALGVTRLAMIDLSTGDQPMHNEDSSVWLVFNGEFYDYRTWMRRLRALGHSFYTQSDTETIVHLYEEFGLNFLTRIRGMFALALWDSGKKTLLLARDKFGVKPLYYVKLDNGVVFASEIKAFVDKIPKEVDLEALVYYFHLRYVPSDMTLFKSVRKLPAASYAIINEGEFSVRNYYSLPTTDIETYFDPAIAVRNLLSESVALRLVSDVPLGVFLSGGIDSSAIVGLMRKLGQKEIRTYSVGFDDEFDELRYARDVAEFFGTNHDEITMGEGDALKILPSVVYHMDEPIADPASVPTFLLAREARRDVKGVLLGEGSDEIFGGYEQYRLCNIVYHARKWVGPKLLVTLAKVIPSKVSDRVFKYSSLLGKEGKRRSLEVLLSESAADEYLRIISVFDAREVEELAGIGSDLGGCVNKYLERYFEGEDIVKESQFFDVENFLQHLLIRADKMTMANSIEAREPFLDHILVEYAFSLPSELKVSSFQEKAVLREALSKVLPPKTLRRKKNRFFVPIQRWFNSELGDLFWQKMDRPSIKIWSKSYLNKLRSSYDESPLYYARQMWSILNLEFWYEMFFPDLETKVEEALIPTRVN
jgi:asparagine synthase (glutamine-hydrolysing)